MARSRGKNTVDALMSNLADRDSGEIAAALRLLLFEWAARRKRTGDHMLDDVRDLLANDPLWEWPATVDEENPDLLAPTQLMRAYLLLSGRMDALERDGSAS